MPLCLYLLLNDQNDNLVCQDNRDPIDQIALWIQFQRQLTDLLQELPYEDLRSNHASLE